MVDNRRGRDRAGVRLFHARYRIRLGQQLVAWINGGLVFECARGVETSPIPVLGRE